MPVPGDGPLEYFINTQSVLFVLVQTIAIDDVALVGQENVKTKHPQLHYESKLYPHIQKSELWICSF
jgi:hypothetical protein